MVKEFIFKVFVISAVIFTAPLYAQTANVSEDINLTVNNFELTSV